MSDKEKGVVGKVISNISKPLAKRRGRGHGGQSGAGTSSSYDNDKSGSEMSRQLKRQPTHPMHMAKQSAHLSGEREKLEEQLGGESIYSDEEIKEDEQPVLQSTLSHGAEKEDSRIIYLNEEYPGVKRPPKFLNNSIKTSKYNILTFIPIFLFEMFSRVAYLYFLLQAALSWWEVVSPFSGVGATMALLFVLLVSAVKAAAEDLKRHKEDDVTNNTKTTLIDPENGVEREVKWKELKVGDVVKVKDDELFPADILCLATGLEDNVCFIRTTNLDGESNLKIRKPVDSRFVSNNSEGGSGSIMSGTKEKEPFTYKHAVKVECEQPNGNLHRFRGRLRYMSSTHGSSSPYIPLSMSEMLLRGTLLKNSNHVYGMVIYTGEETRIQKNAARPPLKMGSFDRFLNIQIAILITVQCILCVLLAIGSYLWREIEGLDRYFLSLDDYVQGNYENGLVYVLINFITFWILTSYMVPISLFVTIEIVKFWQAFVFINNDQSMYHGEEHAHARNSNLNEDLGKIDYIFSDKTGTLTSNDMQLRMINMKGENYGRQSFTLEDFPEDQRGIIALHQFDERLARSVETLLSKNIWKEAIKMGGSGEVVLKMPVSDPKLRRFDTQTTGAIVKEMDQFIYKPYKSSYRELRNRLSHIEDNSENKVILSYPDDSGKLSLNGEEAPDFFLGWHIVDFWTSICVCHSLIIEERTSATGQLYKVYQGPSPDEVALVEAARNLGFIFKERTIDGITLDMQGHEMKLEIMNVLEFTSERKRMSVITRTEDGTIRLYCKGADNVMIARLSSDVDAELREITTQSLYDYSVKGLRTLVLGTKLLREDEYQKWDIMYQKAASSISDDRDDLINECAELIEKDLQLVGITAIEDKLQDGVPMAIESLRLAGIKVWMITGDKMETAINIGISCNLITSQDKAIILTAENRNEAEANISDIKREVPHRLKNEEKVELVIDGPSLVHIIGKNQLEKDLSEIASQCSGVVVCRSSPSQKAAIVKIMRAFEMRKAKERLFLGQRAPGIVKWWRGEMQKIQGKTLGIGDGANDVAMIQAADVGVGIAGKEGRQAVNNSDYALIQFRHVVRLLLVHGQLSHYRLARLIKYSFLKNIAFACILIFYQIYCGYSGQSLIDDISATVYNVVFTSMPILLFAVLDRPMRDETMLRFPQMYNQAASLTTLTFWKTGILQGFVDGIVCFSIPLYCIKASGPKAIHGIWAVGQTIFIALLGVVTLEACLVARYWTKLFVVFCILSYSLVYPYILLFPYIERGLGIYDNSQYGIAEDLLSTFIFWYIIFGVYACTFGMRYCIRCVKWLFNPDDNMILAEFERNDKGGPLYNMDNNEKARLKALDVTILRDDEEEGEDDDEEGTNVRDDGDNNLDV